MIRKLLAIVLALVLVAAGSVYGLWKLGEREFYRPGPSGEASFFFIERGSSLNRVAQDLADRELISSQLVFRLGARLNDQNGLLKYGNYEIPPQSSMDGILALITDSSAATDQFVVLYRVSAETGTTLVHERAPGSGDSREIVRFTSGETPPEQYSALITSGTGLGFRVAVPEGLTSWQIVEALKAADFLQGELATVPPEGAMAPDTYEVKRGSGRDELVQRMVERQQSRLDAEWEDRASDLPISTPQEALILASIIEKETSIDSERELVSSVFVNRLNLSMLLQTDPSVIYGITGGKRPLGRGLRKSELERDGPYNTYKRAGLPPTPIANPGHDTIRAALNPASSDYLFFVADGHGGHAFAISYDEHRKNVRAWRKIEAARSN